jgi:hypothetical protein
MAYFFKKVGKIGSIWLPLTAARKVVANDVPAIAAAGGVLASDTTPILKRVNTATDKALTVHWAATDVIEIQWATFQPPDLDFSKPVYVKFNGTKVSGTDTVAMAVGFWVGVGGSNLGGDTSALTNTLTTYTSTIAATNFTSTTKPWNVTLKPGAHANDVIQVYGAWLEYTRA